MHKVIVATIILLLLVFIAEVQIKSRIPVQEQDQQVQSQEQRWQEWGQQPQTQTQTQQVQQELPMPKNYAEALGYAQQKGGYIFILFTSDECQWCRKMINTTLKDHSVRQALGQAQVCLIYYVNTGKEPEVAQRYKVNRIPAYGIIDCKEGVIKGGSGFKSVDEFMQWLTSK